MQKKKKRKKKEREEKREKRRKRKKKKKDRRKEEKGKDEVLAGSWGLRPMLNKNCSLRRLGRKGAE